GAEAIDATSPAPVSEEHDTPPPTEAAPVDEVQAPRDPQPRRKGPRQIIAIASGKGGAGKSILAASIGIYLAQLGKDVVLVDANLGSGNLHTLIGADQTTPSVQGFLAKEVKTLSEAVVETPFNNLGLISGHGDGMGTANPRPAQKNRLLNQLHALPTDYLIVDTAPGSGFNALDTFLASDIHIVVTQPEPPAIESAFRFIKSAFLRKVKGARGLDDLLVTTKPLAHCGLPTPQQLHVTALEEGQTELATTLREAMADFSPLLVVNKTRTREDLKLGPALAVLGRRHLGLPIEYVGYVEHDDLVWVSVRRRQALLVQFPEAKVCKDLERLARRILARDSPDRTASETLPVPLADQNHYEILGIHPGALEAEVRGAARRVRRMYDAASPAIYGVAPPGEVREVLQRIETAYATLVDPEKSQGYIRSIFPDWQAAGETHKASRSEPRPLSTTVQEGIIVENDLARTPTTPMPTIGPDTVFSGALLGTIREASGQELQDIAAATKISIGHLRAIEEEDLTNTPATVYLRGFLRAIAKHLRLDPKQVVETYLARHVD
ncbi:MAG: helix-turn-helix domain-containing protein, partial [Deltaproteobacteria bacterium]|nr:helix-turn-helix domain-containing protein [Deltaproteobacteria bacterium]